MTISLLMGVGMGFGGVRLLQQMSYDPAVNMVAVPTMRAQPAHLFAPGCRGVACKASQVSGNALKEEQLKKMTNDPGFISALDESGGTSPKTLAAYGVTDKDYSSQDEMMSMVHDLRAKIMTNPTYKEGSIIGAILFEDTITATLRGCPPL